MTKVSDTEKKLALMRAVGEIAFGMSMFGKVGAIIPLIKFKDRTPEEIALHYRNEISGRNRREEHCNCNSGGFDTWCPIHSAPKKRGGW
jgi:hypothetical protein